MKEKLSLKEYFLLSSMLFGMFFGAGNLIFSVQVGNQAGREFIPAILGFCITAVCIPLLGIIALGFSKYEGIHRIQDKVGKVFGLFFSTTLYLAMGPLFAIPRAINLSFTISLEPFIPIEYHKFASLLFSFIFFNIVVFFSMKPKGLVIWIGKLFNPFFLISLSILIASVFMNPPGSSFDSNPLTSYQNQVILKGALDGYNTLDVLTSLAFGIVLVESIQNQGLKDSKKVSGASIIIALMTFLGMTITYFILAYAGSGARHLLGISKNGAEALHRIAVHYFSTKGSLLLGLVVTFACLKTAISLVTASAASFRKITEGRVPHAFFAILFSLISFSLSNFGFSAIIKFSIPFVIFLYPIAIMVIILLLLDGLLNLHKFSIRITLYGTAIFGFIDSIRVLSINHISDIPNMETPISTFFESAYELNRFIPFFNIKLSWIFFGLISLLISILISLYSKTKKYYEENNP